MSAEYSVTVSQLQELVDKVRQTKQAQTVRLADGVVAVVEPDSATAKRPVRRRSGSAAVRGEKYPSVAALAGAAGTLPSPASWQDIRESARDEHLAAKFGRQDS